MHHVLEAKLVVGNMVFIENESEDVSKQDCELIAFYRLAKKLKQLFKRLPICILGDSFYACENVFHLCDTEFKLLKEMEQKQSKNNESAWGNRISYHQRAVNVMETTIKVEDRKTKHYVFITDLSITKKNVERLIQAGRSRWSIENQGFNQQKNLRYHIEHGNSHHRIAIKKSRSHDTNCRYHHAVIWKRGENREGIQKNGKTKILKSVTSDLRAHINKMTTLSGWINPYK